MSMFRTTSPSPSEWGFSYDAYTMGDCGARARAEGDLLSEQEIQRFIAPSFPDWYVEEDMHVADMPAEGSLMDTICEWLSLVV
jgi:hypothetical protein